MKIFELKKKVYELTFTNTTNELKKRKPELVKGLDLRRKQSWIHIYNALKLINDFQQEKTNEYINEQYKFKGLNPESTFADLLNNIESLGKFSEEIEERLDYVEAKINKKKI